MIASHRDDPEWERAGLVREAALLNELAEQLIAAPEHVALWQFQNATESLERAQKDIVSLRARYQDLWDRERPTLSCAADVNPNPL